MVDKPIIRHDWSAFIKLCMWAEPFPSQVVPRFGLAGWEEIHIEITTIWESLCMLSSGGRLSYGSPTLASERPYHLILIWIYLYVSSHVSTTWETFQFEIKAKKTLICQVGPFSILVCRLLRE